MGKVDYEHWYVPAIPTVGYESVVGKNNTDITYLNMDKQLKALEEKVRDSKSDNQRHDALIEAEEQMSPALGANHPLAHLAGIFEGDDWDDVLVTIQRNRQKGIEDEITG